MNQPVPNSVLLALDSLENSQIAVRAAARLSHLLNRGLNAVFIEDLEFVHYAAHPANRHLVTPNGFIRTVTSDSMDRILRATATQLKNEIQRIAREFNLSWEFNTERGDFFKKLFSNSDEHDLMVIFRASKQHWVYPPLGKQEDPGHRIVVLFTGTEASKKALKIAADICTNYDLLLDINICITKESHSLNLHAETDRILHSRGVTASVRNLKPGDPISNIFPKTAHEVQLLVASLDFTSFIQTELEDLTALHSCPIILIR